MTPRQPTDHHDGAGLAGRNCGGCDRPIDAHHPDCIFRQCEHGTDRYRCAACNEAQHQQHLKAHHEALDLIRRTCGMCEGIDQCNPGCTVAESNKRCAHGARRLGCDACAQAQHQTLRRRAWLLLVASLTITASTTFLAAELTHSSLGAAAAAVIAHGLGGSFVAWALGITATVHTKGGQ